MMPSILAACSCRIAKHVSIAAMWSVPLQYSAISLFFFNHTPTTEIYTLSLHDALPILARATSSTPAHLGRPSSRICEESRKIPMEERSEEHTSELKSRRDLVCRLL